MQTMGSCIPGDTTGTTVSPAQPCHLPAEGINMGSTIGPWGELSNLPNYEKVAFSTHTVCCLGGKELQRRLWRSTAQGLVVRCTVDLFVKGLCMKKLR